MKGSRPKLPNQDKKVPRVSWSILVGNADILKRAKISEEEPRALEKLLTKGRNELNQGISSPWRWAVSTCVLLDLQGLQDRVLGAFCFLLFLSGNIYCSDLISFHSCVFSWKDGLTYVS